MLRQGGHVALIRHAYAPGGGDPANFRIGDCATQRNLNNEGRRQARRIGQLFRRNGVRAPVILTSQWCRCRDTARLIARAYPDAEVRDLPVLNSFFQDRSKGPGQTRGLRRFVRRLSGAGTAILVTHQVNITALTGVYPASGEIVVIRAGPAATFRTIARIRTAR